MVEEGGYVSGWRWQVQQGPDKEIGFENFVSPLDMTEANLRLEAIAFQVSAPEDSWHMPQGGSLPPSRIWLGISQGVFQTAGEKLS